MKPKKQLIKLGTPEFKSLQKKWYNKLAKDGFVDAEEYDSPREMLKRWHGKDFEAKDFVTIQASQAYYSEATEMLNWFEFDCKEDKQLWELHANGSSVREIAKKLKKPKSTIHDAVLRLRSNLKWWN